jgi:hypothetical protein
LRPTWILASAPVVARMLPQSRMHAEGGTEPDLTPGHIFAILS